MMEVGDEKAQMKPINVQNIKPLNRPNPLVCPPMFNVLEDISFFGFRFLLLFSIRSS